MRISGRQPFTGETRTKVDHGEGGHNVSLQVFSDSLLTRTQLEM